MLEDLQVNIIGLLEQRVEQAVALINQLKQERTALENQIDQLQKELQQRNETVRDLEGRHSQLMQVESSFQNLQEQHKQQKQAVEEEKIEIRKRVESVIAVLDGLPLQSPQPASTQVKDFLTAGEVDAINASRPARDLPEGTELPILNQPPPAKPSPSNAEGNS